MENKKELNQEEMEDVAGGAPYSEKFHIRLSDLNRWYSQLSEEDKKTYDNLKTKEEKEGFLVFHDFEL